MAKTKDFMLSFPREIISKGENVVAAFLEMYRQVQTGGHEEIMLSDRAVAHTLFNDDTQKAKQAFDLIAALGYAKRVEQNYIIVKRDDMYYPSFVLIKLSEYYELLKAGKTVDKSIALLHHFCCVVCSFSWNIEIDGEVNVVGNVGYSYFEKREKKSYKTIKRYNDELTEMGYITIFPGAYNPEDQRKTCNYYCRRENAEAVSRFINIGNGDKKSKSSNSKRSATAKFNRYKANPSSYSEDQAFAILVDCLKFWDLKKDADKRDELTIFAKNKVIENEKLQNGIMRNINRH